MSRFTDTIRIQLTGREKKGQTPDAPDAKAGRDPAGSAAAGEPAAAEDSSAVGDGASRASGGEAAGSDAEPAFEESEAAGSDAGSAVVTEGERAKAGGKDPYATTVVRPRDAGKVPVNDGKEPAEDGSPERTESSGNQTSEAAGGSGEQASEGAEDSGNQASQAESSGEQATGEDLSAEAIRGMTGARSRIVKAAKAKKKSRRHRRRNRILKVLIALALIAAFIGVANMDTFEVDHRAVIGNKTVSDKKIRKLSGIKKGDSIFFVNPWSVSRNVKTNLYIEDVRVRREFPDTVQIMVTEREPSAQYIITRKDKTPVYVITDASGMVMDRREKKKNVTIVDEVTVTKAQEGSEIVVREKDVYHKAAQLIAAAKAGDIYFKRIKIRGTVVQAYIYDYLVCRARFDNLMDSIESGELKAVIYRLYEEDVNKGTINIGDNNYCSFTP